MTADRTTPLASRARLLRVLPLLLATACAPPGARERGPHDPPAESGAAASDPHGHDPHQGDRPTEGAEPGERSPVHDGHDHEPALGEEPWRVPLAGVRGVSFTAVPAPVEQGVWYPGEARAAEDEVAMLTASFAGVVAAIVVAPGREVPTGTPLLELRSPELAELAAALLTASAERERAAAELAREERLAADGAGAARELEAARTRLAVAAARERAARLALEARGVDADASGATLAVRAPWRGRVSSYDVVTGQGVEAGQRLGMFAAAGASLVRLELPLPGPSAWTPGVETTVRRGDGKSWSARVEGLPASLTPETRRLSYRLRLDGDPLPYPGTPLEVRVPLPAGIVVPQDAVQQIEGAWGVFVAEGDTARFHPIRRGPELGGDVIVLEGLEPGERIATTGAYLLKAFALKHADGGEAHAH